MYIISAFLFLVAAALASPRELSILSDNTCFGTKPVNCLGHQADRDKALTAINKACSRIKTCTTGSGATPNSTVKGRVPGFTATLSVGKQCGGVEHWNVDNCAALFEQIIDEKCKIQWPAEAFQCKFISI